MTTMYEDSLIEITDQEVVLRHYYFPFGGAKRVPWNQIESVQVSQPTALGGKWRLWGTGDLRTWFPLDASRPSRDRIFVAFLRNSSRRIGFTVENSQRVAGILKDRGLLREPQPA